MKRTLKTKLLPLSCTGTWGPLGLKSPRRGAGRGKIAEEGQEPVRLTWKGFERNDPKRVRERRTQRGKEARNCRKEMSSVRRASSERDLSIPPPVPAVALFALPLPMLFALAWALGLWWLVSVGSGLLVLLLRPLPDAVWLWCRTPSSTAGPLSPTSGWPSEQMVWGSLKLQWTGLRRGSVGGPPPKPKPIQGPSSHCPLPIAPDKQRGVPESPWQLGSSLVACRPSQLRPAR